MARIPTEVAWRVIYWNALVAAVLVAMAVALRARRHHVYDRILVEHSVRHGLDPALAVAVIWQESHFNPTARGEAGEIGLMQVTAGAAADWSEAHQSSPLPDDALWDPYTNVMVGTWYLGRAMAHWKAQGTEDPVAVALAEYNAGRENAARWLRAAGAGSGEYADAVTYATTRSYIEEVMARYRRGYQKAP
jgi:soluble lytic murein transglycosylase